MEDITRMDNVANKMSQIVIRDKTVYLSGQVGNLDTDGDDITKQTQSTLDKIDALLAKAGTDKSRLLMVQIWLSDINLKDKMDEVYVKWADGGPCSARATGESKLAKPDLKVEIICIAATKA